jgi:hypothetical protein
LAEEAGGADEETFAVLDGVEESVGDARAEKKLSSGGGKFVGGAGFQ